MYSFSWFQSVKCEYFLCQFGVFKRTKHHGESPLSFWGLSSFVSRWRRRQTVQTKMCPWRFELGGNDSVACYWAEMTNVWWHWHDWWGLSFLSALIYCGRIPSCNRWMFVPLRVVHTGVASLTPWAYLPSGGRIIGLSRHGPGRGWGGTGGHLLCLFYYTSWSAEF